MTRKSRNPNFDQTLEILRTHCFDVRRMPESRAGVLVSKHGAGAVLAASQDKNAPAALVESRERWWGESGVGCWIAGTRSSSRLPKFELPASASQLQGIHLFSEELKQLIGGDQFIQRISWHNERCL